jgi:hypothetical protein
MAQAYASETLRHIKGEQVESDPEDVTEVFNAYIKLVEKMRSAKNHANVKSTVESGLRGISDKNKVTDEYTKKMFKGFTERVKKLEKMLMAAKGGSRRTRRKTRRS